MELTRKDIRYLRNEVHVFLIDARMDQSIPQDVIKAGEDFELSLDAAANGKVNR